MISPEELRRGNIVYSVLDTTKGPLKSEIIIQCIHMNIIESKDGQTWPFNQLEGIPITEEWLIKLGFEKGVSDYYGIGIVYTHKETEITIYDRTNETFSLYRYNDYKVIFSYIHQLQNLIYSLTGEELKLNE